MDSISCLEICGIAFSEGFLNGNGGAIGAFVPLERWFLCF